MPPQTCLHEATFGHRAYSLSADDESQSVLAQAMTTLGTHLAAELCSYTIPAPSGGPAEWIMPGLQSHGIVAARRQVPLTIFEDGSSVTTNFSASALVPRGSGAVHVDITLYCNEAVPEGEPWPDLDAEMTCPLCVQILWMAVGGADPEPVLASIMRWLDVINLPIDPEEEEPLELPDMILADELENLHDRITGDDDPLVDSPYSMTVALRELTEEYGKETRKLNKHIKQLQMELETSRAVTERMRARAEAAERRSRQSAASSTPVPTVPATVADPVDTPAREGHLELIVQQQSDELDRLRAEIFHLREGSGRGRRAQRGVAETALRPAATPTSLRVLAHWAQANLRGRIVVHAKAARAARKSRFADPALVYRVLQAMADHYWTMRSSGDADAHAAWEAFLTTERLTCGPTGAAVQDRRTRAAYLVDWQQRSVELDQHIQGDSSRCEARTFRLYFHWDAERSVVVVGHLPSHLPNSFT